MIRNPNIWYYIFFLHVLLERWMIYELSFTISGNEYAFYNDSLWLFFYLLKPNPNSWVNMRLVKNEVIHIENTKKLPPPKENPSPHECE